MSDTKPTDRTMNDSDPTFTAPSPPPPDPADAAKTQKEIHVVSVPHDNDVLAQDMAELFEEDQVTHQHGSTEPEGD